MRELQYKFEDNISRNRDTARPIEHSEPMSTMGSGKMRKPCHGIRKYQGARLRCTCPSGLQRRLYT